MKRLVILLALLVLVSGCVQQTMEEVPAEVPVETPVAPVETPVETPVTPVEVPVAPVDTGVESLGGDLYRFKLNKPFTFDGKTIVLTDIDTASAQFRVTIEGDQVILVTTKEKEISHGIEVYVDVFKNYGPEDPKTYADVSLKKFVLGPNEYLVTKKVTKLPDGSEIVVGTTRVDSTGVRVAPVTISSDSSSDIVEGKEARFANYTVTNVKTFVKFESYALLKVVPR